MSLRFRCLVAATAAATLALAGCSSSSSADGGSDGSGACAHASDCPAGTTCISHVCVAATPCASSRACPGLVCDTTVGWCVECLTTSDCGSGSRCGAGVCEVTVACTGDRDCSAMAEVCDVAGARCVECNVDTDCATELRCAPDHACVPRVVPDGGVDSGTDGGVDSGTDGGVDLGTDAGMHCSSDAMCSDGVFCNGAERCAPGAAGATPLGCIAGAPPCAAGVCVESSMSCSSCDHDLDSVRAVGCGGTDCNDDDPTVHPGAPEACDGIDSDCSSGGGRALDEDADGDLYAPTAATCTGGPYPKTDCDDHAASVHPGATEHCNGVDDDCDGVVDESPAWSDCTAGESCVGGTCAATPSGHVTSISAGGVFTCALRSAGDIYCWGGQPGYGSLGDGGPDVRAVAGPQVVGIADAIAISAGPNTACAVRTGGTAACWGDDRWGSVGDGLTVMAALTPHVVLGLASPITQIGASSISTCALLAGGQVQCWGGNREGQLGNGSMSDSLAPVYAAGLTSVAALSPSGGEVYCARHTDGTVSCWGDRTWGSIGDGAVAATPQTTPVVSGTPAFVVDELCSGYGHHCGRTGGLVSCWGTLTDGTRSATPVSVTGVTDATAITCGDASDCALHATGTVSCWGHDDHGQLGIGTTSATPISSPTATVTGLSDAVQVSTSGDHTCALRATGDVVCWGYNMFGQLGDGSTTDRSTPVTVMGIPH